MGTIIDAEMKFMKHWGSTQTKAKLSDADIAKLRKSYLLQIKGMVDAHKTHLSLWSIGIKQVSN